MEMVADVLVVHLFGSRVLTAFDFDVVGDGGGRRRRRRSTVNIIVIVSLSIVGGRVRNNGGKLWKVAGRKMSDSLATN